MGRGRGDGEVAPRRPAIQKARLEHDLPRQWIRLAGPAAGRFGDTAAEDAGGCPCQGDWNGRKKFPIFRTKKEGLSPGNKSPRFAVLHRTDVARSQSLGAAG
jgi:hypothetical protein